MRFEIQIEERHEDLEVGTSETRWTPVGWSGFRSPGRYATTVVCVGPCRLLRFDHQSLAAFFQKYPTVGTLFFEVVLGGSHELLSTIRERISQEVRPPRTSRTASIRRARRRPTTGLPPPLMELFQRAAFFEVFDEAQHQRLAAGAESRYFCRGEQAIGAG